MTTADTKCLIDEGAILWIDGADTKGLTTITSRSVRRGKTQ